MLQAWGTGSDVEAWAEATHELEVVSPLTTRDIISLNILGVNAIDGLRHLTRPR